MSVFISLHGIYVWITSSYIGLKIWVLFIAYINTLPDKIESASIFLFAGDNKLFRNTYSYGDALLLQVDIGKIEPGQPVPCSVPIQINFTQ